MDTLEQRSDSNYYQPRRISVRRSVLRATCRVIGVVIFGPLAVLEPAINRILSTGCLLGLLCCLVFRLEDPTGVHHLHYGLMVGCGVGCGVLLTLYYMLMRAIAP